MNEQISWSKGRYTISDNTHSKLNVMCSIGNKQNPKITQ